MMKKDCKLINVLAIVFIVFINFTLRGDGDKGGDPTPSPCDLCPDDYSLVATYQDVIKTKEGTIPGSIHGQWLGTALIQGKYDGHSCYSIPSVLAINELGNPDYYNELDTCDPPSVSASLENNDVDYCIKGTPGEEGFDAVSVNPSYLYKWSYPGGTTGWTQNSQYNPDPFEVARNESVITRDVSVTINDVFINGQDVCDSVADDGTKSTNHTLVAYRPVYEPKLPHFPHEEVTVVRRFPYVIGYELVETHTWVTDFSWKEIQITDPLPTNTGCNCEHSQITYFEVSGLSITEGIGFEIAYDDKISNAVSIAATAGYIHTFSAFYTFGSGKTMYCNSKFIDSNFVPVQEVFYVKWDIVYSIEPIGEPEGYFPESLTPPAPFHKEGPGGGNYFDIKWVNTCCN
ncbi:hypothetical protein JW926_04305 [Candidatus Sumerlaeota bacterium]|nr:hypothetical protein [Candidatus Sumerlaeota bacterium]